MNTIINIIFKHVISAIVNNWFSTLVGILGAVASGWPALQNQFLAGHNDPATVNWHAFLGALWILVSGAISKFALNWKTIAEGVANSAPKAELVKEPEPPK